MLAGAEAPKLPALPMIFTYLAGEPVNQALSSLGKPFRVNRRALARIVPIHSVVGYPKMSKSASKSRLTMAVFSES